MKYCQVVGVRNLADAVGVHCTHKAIDLCFDCGIHVCESHAESCHTVKRLFCVLPSVSSKGTLKSRQARAQQAPRTKDRLTDAAPSQFRPKRKFGRLPTPHVRIAVLRSNRRTIRVSTGSTWSAPSEANSSFPSPCSKGFECNRDSYPVAENGSEKD